MWFTVGSSGALAMVLPEDENICSHYSCEDGWQIFITTSYFVNLEHWRRIFLLITTCREKIVHSN